MRNRALERMSFGRSGRCATLVQTSALYYGRIRRVEGKGAQPRWCARPNPTAKDEALGASRSADRNQRTKRKAHLRSRQFSHYDWLPTPSSSSTEAISALFTAAR